MSLSPVSFAFRHDIINRIIFDYVGQIISLFTLRLLTVCVLAKGTGICELSWLKLSSINFKNCVNLLVIRCINIIVSVSRSCVSYFDLQLKICFL